MVQTSGRAKSLVLPQVFDGDRWELLGRVLDEVAEDGLIVVANNVDLLNLLVGHTGNGREAVPDDGVAGNIEERLGDVERKGAETSASRGTTDLKKRFPVSGGGKKDHVETVGACKCYRRTRAKHIRLGSYTRMTALVAPDSLGR